MESVGLMRPEFWRDKRVFLTGHTGFKGSWLAIWLHRMGAKVRGFALEAPTRPSLFIEAEVASQVESVIGDIRNRPSLTEALTSFAPEIVIHMAAQSLVRPSYEAPAETFDTNVMGTVNLLEAIRNAPSVKAAVVVTSDKCYENRGWIWGYREADAMGGSDPYSASKGCAELVTSSYRRSFFANSVALATARAGNVIGGGDWAEARLIPDAIRAFAKHETLTIRSPSATRPWQHVLEPLGGYLTLAERLYDKGAAFAEGWNFGPRGAASVKRVIGAFVEAWPGASWEATDDCSKKTEAKLLRLDSTKAEEELGWRARLGLDEAIVWSASWYLEHLGGRQAQDLVERDICAYEALMSAPEQ